MKWQQHPLAGKKVSKYPISWNIL